MRQLKKVFYFTDKIILFVFEQERKAFQFDKILWIFLFETLAEKILIFDSIEPVEPMKLLKSVEPVEPRANMACITHRTCINVEH